MLSEIDDNEGYLQRVMFTDEATFHINGCVNCYNCRIWGSQELNESFEYERDTPKVNVCCGLPQDRMVGPLFFVERTTTGEIYLDLLQQFVFPQVDEIERENATGVVFQQDGVLLHFSLQVRLAMNARFPNRWINSLASKKSRSSTT
jgi:hypothetical protein